jgi:1-deoxy-D-xylulose-5-phosphate reductoisomerase
MRFISILGSTGSIGKSTLDVIRHNRDRFSVVSLAANTNVQLMVAQCQEFLPRVVVMASSSHADQLKVKLEQLDLPNIIVKTGQNALCEIAQSTDTDTVMAAIVGASGLLPTLAAIKQGKRILLANKEALVTSGSIFMNAVKQYGAELLPIDSEHNAIFQCLPAQAQESNNDVSLAENGISKILLTGSGGPFRLTDIEQLSSVTPDQACAHPTWNMGRKISVDSATMMNKGLEFIEAKWLFNVSEDDIQVVLHPQSTIHSMVQYQDGSVVAQMGNPDMRTPIAHAMAFPERVNSGVEPLDFFALSALEFAAVDFDKYPNLQLAIDACRAGQGACTALNAANEVAVDAFLSTSIKFTDIFKINETSVSNFVSEKVTTIDEVIALDQKVREFSLLEVEKMIISNKKAKTKHV